MGVRLRVGIGGEAGPQVFGDARSGRVPVGVVRQQVDGPPEEALDSFVEVVGGGLVDRRAGNGAVLGNCRLDLGGEIG